MNIWTEKGASNDFHQATFPIFDLIILLIHQIIISENTTLKPSAKNKPASVNNPSAIAEWNPEKKALSIAMKFAKLKNLEFEIDITGTIVLFNAENEVLGGMIVTYEFLPSGIINGAVGMFIQDDEQHCIDIDFIKDHVTKIDHEMIMYPADVNSFHVHQENPATSPKLDMSSCPQWKGLADSR